MIVIAVSAVSIPLFLRLRTLYYAHGFLVRPSVAGWTLQLVLLNTLSLVANLGAHAVVMATIAVLTMRLRYPRPPFRRLACQPGFVACCAVALTLALSDLEYLGRVSIQGVDNPFQRGFSSELFNVVLDGFGYSFTRNGYAVSATWLMLALGSRWRPESSWIDRIGRAIGVFWIVMIAAYWSLPLLAVAR
jgi:hypothetical protein